MSKYKIFFFILTLIFSFSYGEKNIIENIVDRLSEIKNNNVFYINENMFFVKNSNLNSIVNHLNDKNIKKENKNDNTTSTNNTSENVDENNNGENFDLNIENFTTTSVGVNNTNNFIYNSSNVDDISDLFNITSDIFKTHSLIYALTEEVNLKISTSNSSENEIDHDFEADIILDKDLKSAQSGRGQHAFLPIMYVLGVITTMLKVLTFLTLKGLTIGMVLLTVAYTYSLKHKLNHGHHGHHGLHGHHGHHGHHDYHHLTPSTIIKSSGHSYPSSSHYVPKYHSHYSHHPHHHHPPLKKYYFTPPPGYGHDSHHHGHPETIEIAKHVHVHNPPHHVDHHNHIVPHIHQSHSYEVQKELPILEELPAKHEHHIDYHSVKKRYPHSSPIIDYASSYDMPKSAKSYQLSKTFEHSGLQSLYDIQRDYSNYAAAQEDYSNNYKNEFTPEAVREYAGPANAQQYQNGDSKRDYTAAYFTTHPKDYSSLQNPFKLTSMVGQSDYSVDFKNNVYPNQQSEYGASSDYSAASSPYNTDSSYSNQNSYDQSANSVKYQYSASAYNPDLTPLLDSKSDSYKSSQSNFLVNLPNLPDSSGDSSSTYSKISNENVDSNKFSPNKMSAGYDSQKTYDSNMNPAFADEISSYNDQKQDSFENDQNDFDNAEDGSSNSFVKSDSNSKTSIQSRESTFSNDDKDVMSQLEFEPAWAYILFNNQNIQNTTLSPRNNNDLDMDTSQQVPVIKC